MAGLNYDNLFIYTAILNTPLVVTSWPCVPDNKLFESAEGHHLANAKLTVELEQLKKENLELMVKLEAG